MLNEALNVVESCGFEQAGEVVTLKEVIDAERASIISRADEERIALIAEPLRDVPMRAGDHLLFDAKSGYVLEKLPKPEVDELILEEIPDITLRGRRWPARADHLDPGRRRAAVHAPRAVRRAQAARHRRASSSTDRRAAARR